MPEPNVSIRPIIGLEIHVQLRTDTKMFCSCPVTFDAPPNSFVCPVCLGHPGSLPVINRQAFALSVLTGMALDCTIARHTRWDRKSYYYPDMPKNYQISQYDLPLAADGRFDVPTNGGTRRVRIRRAHLEEDAGKNIHDTPGCTLVDLNRAGTPLLEIVTEPDLGSAEESYTFCVELHRLVTYLGVSEGNMKKGQMRFEPNVNVAIKHEGAEVCTPISEIKNLNSFRHVRDAIAYEIKRQAAAWRENKDYQQGRAPNENRGWNDERGVTEFQRGKEGAHDYRYFPDPDLVPVELTEEALNDLRSSLPELPIARQKRFVEQFGLSRGDAQTITAHRPTADLFDAAIASGAPPTVAAKQFVNIWSALANARSVAVTDLNIDARALAELAKMVAEGAVSATSANQLAEAMADRAGEQSGGPSDVEPRALADELGLLQVRDADTTQAWVDQVFAENEQAVQDARSNPKKAKAAAGFLRGQVMKVSQGRADPKLAGQLIEKRLTGQDTT